LGDDLMDEDAFRALQDQRTYCPGAQRWRETSADLWIRPPGEPIGLFVAVAASL